MTTELAVLKAHRPASDSTHLRPPNSRGVLGKLGWIFGFDVSMAPEMPSSGQIGIRLVSVADRERLREFVRGLSTRTRHDRLLSPCAPTQPEVDRLASADGARDVVLIATVGSGTKERIIGVARYAVAESRVAKFAIVLADAWQGRGLGAELLGQLIDFAREAGIARLHGVTLSTNTRMLLLGRRLGFRQRISPAASWLTVLELGLAG
jgi:acetyltransferase